MQDPTPYPVAQLALIQEAGWLCGRKGTLIEEHLTHETTLDIPSGHKARQCLRELEVTPLAVLPAQQETDPM